MEVSKTHTYKAAGTYQVRIVALSGGSNYRNTSVTVNLNAAPIPTIPAECHFNV
jgi:PKD repeat protein